MSREGIARPFVGTAVFVIRDGKFLFQQRKGSHGEGTWSTPGGYLEFGETLKQCAQREVREETGMEIKNVRIGAVTNDIFENDGKHFVTVWLVSEWKSGEPRITEPDKCIRQRWVDFDSLPQPLFQPWEQFLVSDFLARVKNQM